MVLVLLEDLLEVVMLDVEHDVGIHLDEAAIGIPSEAVVPGRLRERLDGVVVEAQIQHRVHHAGHGGARARAHRNQQRIRRVAEFAPGDRLDMSERRVDLGGEFVGVFAPVGVERRANLRGDGEAGRHGQAQIGHFGEVRAFAAEQIAHLRLAFGLAVAERVNPLGHGAIPR